MLLSQIFLKTISTGDTARGSVVGVVFSLKTGAIKHLLCSTRTPFQNHLPRSDFAVNISSISAIADKISLARLRPIIPKTQTALFPNLPIYSQNGVFLGNLTDGKINNFILTQINSVTILHNNT